MDFDTFPKKLPASLFCEIIIATQIGYERYYPLQEKLSNL